MSTGEEMGKDLYKYTLRTTGRISKDILLKMSKEILESIRSGSISKRGKQSLKSLVGLGQEVSLIDLNQDAINDFSKYLQEHGIDFAIGDQNGEEVTVFFKTKDVSLIEHALKKYVQSEVSVDRQNQEQANPAEGIEQTVEKKKSDRAEDVEKSSRSQKPMDNKETIEKKVVRAKEKASEQKNDTVKKTKHISKDFER